ncbi:MAG: alpha/beta hydrolase [Clostridia bacterium]
MNSEDIIDVNTAKIHYEVYGSGEYIILLHGNGGSTRSFDKQLSAFSSKYTLVCIDARGQGKSTLGDIKLNIDLLADDVIAVMDHLNIKTANVIGFSDGGNVAINLGIRHKKRFTSLIISGANLFPEGIVSYLKPALELGYLAMKIGSIFSYKAKVKRELFSLLVKHPHVHPMDLSTINVPVLVLAGERDLITREHTNLITKNIKKSVQYIVKDSDHFIMDEKPDEFNSIVLDYLETVVYR